MGQVFELRVFGEASWQGNPAHVHLSAEPCSGTFMESRAWETGQPASCFTWPGDGVFQARCYSPAGRIACCGHGLLATGHVWMRQRGLTHLRLDQDDGSGALEAWRQDGMDWLGLPRMGCQPVPKPAWWREAFSREPLAAAQAAGESGYLILDWDSEASLRELEVYPAAFGRHTRRAVVALAPAGTPGFDYVLRYFAPQYGVAEDAVTGSAHRLACEYRGQSQARGLQCSMAGGVVYTRLDADQVAIGGRVVCSE